MFLIYPLYFDLLPAALRSNKLMKMLSNGMAQYSQKNFELKAQLKKI